MPDKYSKLLESARKAMGKNHEEAQQVLVDRMSTRSGGAGNLVDSGYVSAPSPAVITTPVIEIDDTDPDEEQAVAQAHQTRNEDRARAVRAEWERTHPFTSTLEQDQAKAQWVKEHFPGTVGAATKYAQAIQKLEEDPGMKKVNEGSWDVLGKFAKGVSYVSPNLPVAMAKPRWQQWMAGKKAEILQERLDEGERFAAEDKDDEERARAAVRALKAGKK